MNQSAFLDGPSIVQGLFKTIENKVSFGRPRDPPSDDAISKCVDEQDQCPPRQWRGGPRPASAAGCAQSIEKLGPLQEPRKHQPHRRFRINPRPTEPVGIKIGRLGGQPRQVQNPVHPNQNGIIRDQIAQRPADEELQLIAFLPTQHPHPPKFRDEASESDQHDFINSPTGLFFRSPQTPRRRHQPNGKSLRREYLGDKDEQE